MKVEVIKNNQNNPNKEQRWKTYTSNFQSHYKATVPRQYGSVIRIDIVDQWNQIMSLEIDPYIYY